MNRKLKRILLLIGALCVSGFLIFTAYESMEQVSNPITSFKDITKENIGSGMYINADVDYISDSYMQTLKEDGVEQRKYYLLPLGDGTLATIEIKEEHIDNAEKILDYSYYLDGHIEETAVENIEDAIINWKGHAEEMTDEMIEIFNKAFKDWGYTEEQIETLRTPYIIVYSEPIGVAMLFSVSIALGITSFIMLAFVLIKKDPNTKKTNKKKVQSNKRKR